MAKGGQALASERGHLLQKELELLIELPAILGPIAQSAHD
jgi:hypothetical protein